MLEIIKSGGWLMLPIIFCSVAAITICIERFWALNPAKIAPRNCVVQVWSWIKNNQINAERLEELRKSSPLGEILAAGLANSRYGRDVMKESIEDAAGHVVHEMERYLSTLGTITEITPMLGLLGTVVGMIQAFSGITLQGSGNTEVLAGGISQALITTAAGLSVAIPALIMHRYFHRRIDTIVLSLEQESLKLVDALHGEGQVDLRESR